MPFTRFDIQTQALGEEKYEILLIFRDMCTTHKLSEDDFSQFLIDFASDYPDSDYMTSKYGSQYTDCWNDIHHLISYAQNSCSLTINQIVDFVFHTDTSDYKKTDEGIQIPGSALKQDIKDSTLTFYPTGNCGMVSWKTDAVFGASQFNEKRNWLQFTLYAGNCFFGVDGFTSGYAVPFVQDENGVFYFSDNELHLSTVSDPPLINIAVQDCYSDTVYNEGVISSFDVSTYPFVSCGDLFRGYFSDRFRYYSDFSRYSSFQYDKYSGEIFIFHNGNSNTTNLSSLPFYKSSDLSTYIRSDSVVNDADFKNTLTGKRNFGFFISDTKIKMDGWAKDIDVDKISDNDIITITGDTIYDYEITNSTTGDTSTITEYMNNNYTYITNNSGGDGGSGTSGGNVTVGGNVGVNGNVDVGGDVNIHFDPIEFDIPPIDINVNVSGSVDGSAGSGGSGGTSENPGDYIDPGEVNTSIDDYLEHIPEVSKGFIDYLKDFFSWLPKEIYGLLILGLLVAVFCRLNGR